MSALRQIKYDYVYINPEQSMPSGLRQARKYILYYKTGQGFYICAYNVELREEDGYTMETSLIYGNEYKAQWVERTGRYSQKKADILAKDFEQLKAKV